MEEQKKNPAQGLSESEQVQVRRQKLADLQAAGHDPRKRWRVLSNSMMSSCIKTGSWPVRSRRRGLHSSGRRRIS